MGYEIVEIKNKTNFQWIAGAQKPFWVRRIGHVSFEGNKGRLEMIDPHVSYFFGLLTRILRTRVFEEHKNEKMINSVWLLTEEGKKEFVAVMKKLPLLLTEHVQDNKANAEQRLTALKQRQRKTKRHSKNRNNGMRLARKKIKYYNVRLEFLKENELKIKYFAERLRINAN